MPSRRESTYPDLRLANVNQFYCFFGAQMDVFADIEQQILSTVRVLARRGVFALPAGSLPPRGLAVEPPRDPAHGDIATNAALVLARPLGRKPREIAEVLAPALAESDGIARAEVAGPGFINLTLEPAVWQGVVGAILRAGGRYGRTNLGRALRRAASDAGIPWVACTGHGYDSISRAIRRAAEVVRSKS